MEENTEKISEKIINSYTKFLEEKLKAMSDIIAEFSKEFRGKYIYLSGKNCVTDIVNVYVSYSGKYEKVAVMLRLYGVGDIHYGNLMYVENKVKFVKYFQGQLFNSEEEAVLYAQLALGKENITTVGNCYGVEPANIEDDTCEE